MSSAASHGHGASASREHITPPNFPLVPTYYPCSRDSHAPRLLDLFSGAGGAAMGYHRAGFEVTGVDNRFQPRYPFKFVQADALEYVAEHGHKYDVIHASPPCQGYSVASLPWKGKTYPDLVVITRNAISEKPYVIENVVAAPLLNSIMLCGVGFGLKVYRHRLFESNLFLFSMPHHKHPEPMVRAGRGATAGGYIAVVGNFGDVAAARKAMGIDWMTRNELSQAVPPAYTEFIGEQLMLHLKGSESA